MLKEGMIVGERYEIISRIGSGGMADVYKAKDNKLNRLVAVKVMKAEFSQDRGFISKFRKEAQAAAGLAHPNVVNVYDVGDDNGIYYIVMELVQGITLKDYITRKGKLTVREATSIAIQVSLGLECAHRSNIIHRDVKPQNIIISTDGKVKLSDFGIARAASSNTISSNVMGSVHYSSPEQVRGGYSDAKSDIYSLGITMYEMVTGRVPYDGDTTVAIAIKHLQEEMESPRKFVPDLPYSLEQIILKCTQKSPDRRYASMSELIEDLKHSLLDPNGRFVILTPLSNHAQTMMLSADELEAIREGRSGYATQQPASYDPQYQEDEDEDDDEEEYDDEDDDDSEISSKLKKAMTIGGYIIGAIVICILIFVIGRAAGILKFGEKKEKEEQVNQEQQLEEDEKEEEAEESKKVSVPKLLTLTEENALSVLEQMGLKGKKVSEEESEHPAGTVISQEIQEGTEVDPGTVVNYVISTGVNSPEVPDVKGNSQSEAEAKIKALGLETEIKQEYSDEVPIGEIISVDPKPGTILKAGEKVTLVVSLGEENKMIPVPDVAGKAEADAKKILGDSGFKVQVETTKEAGDNVADGQVKLQKPEAGKEVEPGSVVTITVYHKPQETPEPTKEEKPEEKPTEKPEEQKPEEPEEPSKWMTHVQLEQPESYTGGNVRLRLIQEVEGQQIETILLEGQPITFPYILNVEGAQGVDTGVVYLEELVDGSYVERGHYSKVTFKETKPKKES